MLSGVEKPGVWDLEPDLTWSLEPEIRIGAVEGAGADVFGRMPITRHLADAWLRKAEKLAGLQTQKGSLWHAFRRKWATERKHLPDVDGAAAGGWKTVQTLKTAYQPADAETMLGVVLEPGQLREAK